MPLLSIQLPLLFHPRCKSSQQSSLEIPKKFLTKPEEKLDLTLLIVQTVENASLKKLQALLYTQGKPTFILNTCYVPHREDDPIEKRGEHANMFSLIISSSKMKSKCIEVNCLTDNLPSQLECSFKGSTGRRSVCFTEAIYPNSISAEMGETRNSSWYLKQFSQKSSY